MNESTRPTANTSPVPSPEPPAPRPGPVTRLLRTLPTLLVLLGLAALAYAGHRTGWTLPRFSALAGRAPAEKDDWCEAHGVPESQCVECQPDLLPRAKGVAWCKDHQVPECPFEHPELAQLKAYPHITAADRERARRALEFTERPENNRKCKLHERRIQFASRAAFEKAGIEVEPVWQAPIAEAVSASGEVTYDQTRVARLSARVPGTAGQVLAQVGDRVRKGQVLALVDAAEVGRAKAELVQALLQAELKAKALERLRAVAGPLVPEGQLQETEATAREAQIRLATAEQALANLGLAVRAEDVRGLRSDEVLRRLRFLGLPPDLAAGLDARTATANLLPLTAPLDGVVVAREVVAGEVVDTAKVLFTVADTGRMWLTLNLRLEDARQVALGQPVRFRADGDPEEVSGTVAWKSTGVDEKTRTLKVRADLPNPDGRLHANTFGRGRIILREEQDAVVVPNEAVHWEGDCFVVFVQDKNFHADGAPKVFHVRKVQVGARDEKHTEIVAGVLPREVVATRGSGTLRAELLKNNLGEG